MTCYFARIPLFMTSTPSFQPSCPFAPSHEQPLPQSCLAGGLLLEWMIAGILGLGLSQAIQAQSDRVVITTTPGYSITWDGNNGGFSSPEPGASAPDNLALASKGATAFGSTAYLPGGIHD